MKKIFSLFLALFTTYSVSYAQSTPTPLRPDLTVSHLVTVSGGATRLAFNKSDSSLYYSKYNGNIYKVIVPASGIAYDTLVYSISDHGIQAMQGMDIFDSTIYVSGNIDPDSAYTIGKISAGKLQPNGTRIWYTVAQTVPYETSGIFDHLLSGLKINENGDTLLICSGSRGDHNEIESRDSLFPGLRNLPITSLILQVPAASVNLIIPNDSAAMDALGIVFARGIRNTYDFGYNAVGDLFGPENSGDRDMEDEINWLRPGHHYGFPWMMGSLYNPQQFAGYDTSMDLLLNHNSYGWKKGIYSNDSLFPQKPPGLQLDLPCKNYGPDAAYMRDSITGATYNAALVGQPIYSLTPHRSPLGITFDNDSVLGGNLRGNGYVLSYTRGNSLLNDSSPVLTPFNDNSEDLMMLEMQKDTIADNYSFHAYKIVEGFSNPIDAVLRDTNMYVIEIGYNGYQSIWIIHFPRYTSTQGIHESTANTDLLTYPSPADKSIIFKVKNATTVEDLQLQIYNQIGQKMKSIKIINSANEFTVNTTSFDSGIYYFRLVSSSEKYIANGRFIIMH